MKRRQKIASVVIDGRQLSQIDFDLLVGSHRCTPSHLCLSHPGALELARQFKPAYLAIFVNRYPQHIVANVLCMERAKVANLLNAGKVVNWSGWISGVCQ